MRQLEHLLYMGNALYGRMAIRPYAPYYPPLNAEQLRDR